MHLEDVPAEGGLRFLYETPLGRLLQGAVCGWRGPSALLGWWQGRAWTRRRIGPFVRRFQIDTGEVELPPDQYPSFNAFFTRRLRPGARPFAPEPEVLCAPADGRALVFPSLDPSASLPIKGCLVAPPLLLAGKGQAAPFRAGAALVVRLAPADYHRFHFPAEAWAGPARRIRGRCHSVNPIALERRPALYQRNQRAVTLVNTEAFGRIAYVEVGALAVASIVQTYVPGPVRRGQEKGFFQFGGSSVVLLFEPQRVTFDADLVGDSEEGLEVHVRAGSRIGVRC
ncbi:MAG: phosphatidylserine decarboxylase [Candidatus Latescibacterota bacterium]